MTRINREMVPKFFGDPARCCMLANVYDYGNTVMPNTPGMSGHFVQMLECTCVISMRKAALCTWHIGASCAVARVYACAHQ